jgi:(R,R)-butanediol dehydrogenase/meso-butanediol dehydrogenase/diacetyl reductase
VRAAGLYDRALRIDDRSEPAPGEGELLVAVHLAGICGSDIFAAGSPVEPGFVLGHEVCGEIVAVGAGVDRRRIGERVAVLPIIGCGACAGCLAGAPARCPTYRALGVTTSGGFAELVLAGDRESFRLPDHLGDAAGALVEPLAIALHTINRARLTGLETVLVLGAGPIGLAVIAWLAARGHRRIAVSDPVAVRRQLAVDCGADLVIDPASDDVAGAARAALGGKPEVIFDCAGGRLGEAVMLAGHDATIVVAGVHANPVPVDTQRALLREVDVRFASWYTTAEFEHTIDAVGRDRLAIGSIVTHRITLDELPAMYQSLQHPNEQGKVLVSPR